MFFGSGRAQLLSRIEKHGSLKKAAQEMGMSYRAAWGKIRASEKSLGVQLIERRGTLREGYALTPYGRLLMLRFEEWFASVEQAAVQEAKRLFPFKILAFGEAESPPVVHTPQVKP